MTILMKCHGLANGESGPQGQFLQTFDPHTGFSDWTADPNEAMEFETREAAWDLWRMVHATDPVRPWDDRPNRPLTAFTVEIGEF